MKTNLACLLRRGALIALWFTLLSAPPTRAAVLTYAGTQTDLGSGWRTPSSFKPLDLDGDNVLGTDGYHLVNLAPVMPGYVTAAAILTSTYPGNGFYAQLDDPNNLPARFTTGTMNPAPGTGASADLFQFSLSGNAPTRTIRVGLLVDNLDGANWNATSLSLVQTSGASVTNGPVATTAAAFNNRIPDWVFFDITGASAGDTFIIRGIAGINGAATLGGVVFDSGVTALVLGTTNLTEGPAAGRDSVVLGVTPATAAYAPWTAASQAPWLHLSPGFQSGNGSTNVIFSFDANPGATRTGTLTIAGQTVTVTQAGSTYVAAGVVTSLNTPLSILGFDITSSGDLIMIPGGTQAIWQWSKTNNSSSVVLLAAHVTTNLNQFTGVAVDAAGLFYVTDRNDNTLKRYMSTNFDIGHPVPQPAYPTYLATNLNNPRGLAMDAAGNVYFSDYSNGAVKEWTAANGGVTTIAAQGFPTGPAVDVAGNVYFEEIVGGSTYVWRAANNSLKVLVPSTQVQGTAVFGSAVDGSGNVYLADFNSGGCVWKWTAASGTVAKIASGLTYPYAVAVDGDGNVYIGSATNVPAQELPRAFVDPTPRVESSGAGSDALPAVLPLSANLRAPFAPTSDQPWLTITGTAGGVVSFAFTANHTGTNRIAHIGLLGKTIPITQTVPFSLANPQRLANGTFQFSFTNTQASSFRIWTATNVALPPAQWTPLGAPASNGLGWFEFSDPQGTDSPQRFYRVSTP
jgi:sugar lactone lactonase YvrE